MYYSFDLFYSFFWIFFFPFPTTPSVVFVNFIGTTKFNWVFEVCFFFSFNCMFYCYKPLPLHWAFVVLCSFLFWYYYRFSIWYYFINFHYNLRCIKQQFIHISLTIISHFFVFANQICYFYAKLFIICKNNCS